MDSYNPYMHHFSPSTDSHKEALRVHNIVTRLYEKTVGKIRKKFTSGGAGTAGEEFEDIRCTISTIERFGEKRVLTEYYDGRPGEIRIYASPLTIEEIHKVLTPQPE